MCMYVCMHALHVCVYVFVYTCFFSQVQFLLTAVVLLLLPRPSCYHSGLNQFASWGLTSLISAEARTQSPVARSIADCEASRQHSIEGRVLLLKSLLKSETQGPKVLSKSMSDTEKTCNCLRPLRTAPRQH